MNNRKKIIFIGAGGHAKSVYECLDKSIYELVGFLDSCKKGYHMGIPILGDDFECIHDKSEYLYFVSIGNNQQRKKWFEKLCALGLQTINVIDSTAIISNKAVLGVGNFIAKMVIVNADVNIGDNNILNTRALIEHECTIGSHVHLSTGSIINGDVQVKDSVFLGSGAICNGQITIEENAVIGSGSVVIHNMESNVIAVGVPARIIKRNQNE